MLISKIPDNEGSRGESVSMSDQDSDSHEYQTANELFELMAQNQDFDNSDVDKLTTRDLVLLYKNIDLGTKLMSNATELRRRRPNQHVESVVYRDDSDSDASERYSCEDLRTVFQVNHERLDLINAPSAENTLCHKLGDLQMRTSNLAADYDKHFLFKDPYISEQLKSLKLMNKTSEFEGAVLPASLLDYICCKRLEDNYNFYMDNIIRYVKNTIDQLKRISNGDYLTDRAKEKWREVPRTADDVSANTKVLATSTSIPLHVERKTSGGSSTWDDIVHSAVDIRSLSKILEKKIVVEVPKLLCGPYKLLSRCCAENLIISCKKDERPVEERLDVLLQLHRSESGQVVSNINSIMILQSAPVKRETRETDVLPLTYMEPANALYVEQTNNNKYLPERKPKIIELEQTTYNETVDDVFEDSVSTHSSDNPIETSYQDGTDYACSDNDVATSVKNTSFQESNDFNDAFKHIINSKLKVAQSEASRDLFPDDLRVTMQKLNMQSAVTEESGEDFSQSPSKKRKSPTRVRIKSPYENQSYIMEEKKRRKLLEIRERREKKKMALVENCKITKHKYTKGTVLPQSASSVTKLSISNKSFYNSIYGQANGDPNKPTKGRNRKGGKRDVLDLDIDMGDTEGEYDVSVASTSDKNSKKYINRSYYLDEADTEMMYINVKQNENDPKDTCSTSNSVISNAFRNNLNYLSQLMGPSESDLNIEADEIFPEKDKQLSATGIEDTNDESTSRDLLACKSVLKVPENSPTRHDQNNSDTAKLNSSVECRKSIDKIYTLMYKLENAQETETKPIMKSKFVVATPKKVDEKEGRMSSTCQGSDSGTSVKHHIISSNPSSFSFDRNNTEKPNNIQNKKRGSLSPIVPKVIISSKSPSPKIDIENNRKNRKKLQASPTKNVAENPLKAISQLLHEFENVQKNRQKPNTEKNTKKVDLVSISDAKSSKSVSRKSPLKRRSRLDHHNESETDRYVRLSTPKEKKPRQLKDMDSPKTPHQKNPVDDKNTEKPPRKKIVDILDEAKEARGEAVRGPSKLLYSSRLNTLAQPKKTYVQAHNEEYQTKYGKNLLSGRLQKLAATPHSWDRPAGSGNARNKARRSGTEAVAAATVLKPPSPVPPPERVFRARHSRSSSPGAKERLAQVAGASYKQANVPETPQALKKKMVAVESYVKNHYGRARPALPSINNPQSVQKLRVPLLPNDIELASSTSSALTSFQESTELGSRLHNIISTIMKTTATQGLEVLPECHETISLAENISCDEVPSSGSDFILDILNDNDVKTSVENTDRAAEKDQKQSDFEKLTSAMQNYLQPVRSVTELEMLESTLCNHVPVGSFQKRLRIKNLTMTPKQSMQNVIVLQSGDAASLVVKTPIAKNIKNKSSENFSDLTVLPILSKSHLDWNFANFPMKISTVGYAFPEYKPIKGNSNSVVKLLDEIPLKSELQKHLKSEVQKHLKSGVEQNVSANYKIDRASHTSKDAPPTLRSEQAAQADILPAATLATVGISTSFTHIKESDEKQEIKPNNDIIAQPTHVFNDIKAQPTHVFNDIKAQSTHAFNDIKAQPTRVFNDIKAKPTHVFNDIKAQPTHVFNDIKAQPTHVFNDINQPMHVFLDFIQNQKQEDTLNGEQTQIQPVIQNKESVPIVNKPEDIEYTTSLDILVGLLNEIQNISTCQTQMAQGDKIPPDIQQTKVLETILMNEAAALENSLKSSHCDVVSLTSLERLRQLESNPSLYSFYLSDSDGSERGCLLFPNYSNELCCVKRIFVDREVGGDLADGEAVAKSKDMSSQLLPVGMSHIAVASHPLIRVLSEPSIQSMLFAECRPEDSDASPLNSTAVSFGSTAAPLDLNAASFDVNAAPFDANAAQFSSNAAPFDANAAQFDANAAPFDANAAPFDANAAPFDSNAAPLDCKTVINIPQIVITADTKKSLEFYDVGNQIIKSTNENKSPKKITESFEKERIKTMRKANNGKFRFKTDFDPIMKMKRDILVTVYSILVFTVFAALSFPEILYRI